MLSSNGGALSTKLVTTINVTVTDLAGGGGAGGRIAVYANTSSFTGTMQAHGGRTTQAVMDAHRSGGAGTVYVYVKGEEERSLTVDNGGYVSQPTIVNESSGDLGVLRVFGSSELRVVGDGKTSITGVAAPD